MMKTAKEYLDYIADRLYCGHASLFVGAGFSKNAVLISGGKLPPDWNELGKMFFEKARCQEPSLEDLKFANVLRLAEEVECACGRGALTQLITMAINNNNIAPSELHAELLSLPWKDVFTTNYDTLLDRTAERLNAQGGRGYSIITNDQEIGISTPPFLMKLHGDIKSPNSIVITEEDYRKYPAQHPAIIAHIQHTIMLETMVLIGFSGNDPNFIQWLGWVKDALSKKQRKVYLLSIGDVSKSVIKTFRKKNVIIVDLRDFAGKGATPSANISAAILHIVEYQRKQEEEITRYQNRALEWGQTSSRDEDVTMTFKKWQEERDTYPGWLITPRDKREYIASLDGFSISETQINKLEGKEDLLFLDLFNWRIEKCLFPISNDWEPIYLSVLSKYKPYEGECGEDVKVAWVNLKLGLLRLYRQEGWKGKWISLNSELFSLKERITLEQRCRLAYEEALMSVYQCDFDCLERILIDWPEQKDDPYWDIRRGSLWAEYISLEKGLKLTKVACETIQKRFEAADNVDRFYWGSRMVHSQTIWNCMRNANFSINTNAARTARSIWNKLRSYDDIWYEREFFDANLRPIEQVASVQTKEVSFSLGHYKTSTNISGNAKDYRISYAYFLYYEESGFPIHLPNLNAIQKPTLEKALSVMSYSSPAIAESWLLRSGDPKSVAVVFNRRYLDRSSYQEVSDAYNRYLAYLEMLLEKDQGNTVPSWVLVFRHILPEILSRLCMKASFVARVRTLEIVDRVLGSENVLQYNGLDKLLLSLILSFSNAQNAGLIPMYARMNAAIDRFDDFRLEPFKYLKAPEYYHLQHDSELVISLFNGLGKSEYGDKVLLYRLMFLQRCGALSGTEQEKLAEVLWRKRDEFGFPSGTPYAKFSFLSMPHPAEVNPQELLSAYFASSSLPRMGIGGAIGIYGGTIPLLNEIKGTSNRDIKYIWNTELLNKLCADIVGLWESDKGHLGEKDSIMGFSITEELKGRIRDIGIVLIRVVSPNLQLVNSENRRALAKMITELEEYSVPSLRVKVALKDILDIPIIIGDEIKKRMGSSDGAIVDDCIQTVYYLETSGEDVSRWVEMMSEYFRSNSIPGRNFIISGLAYFMKKVEINRSVTIRENLIIGLDRLFGETEIFFPDSELVANEKMHLRMMVAPIVRELIDIGVENTNLSLYKAYYESENTCWDVRNRYDDGEE